MARKLIPILRQAGQEVDRELEDMASRRGGGGGRGRGRGRRPAAASAEADAAAAVTAAAVVTAAAAAVMAAAAEVVTAAAAAVSAPTAAAGIPTAAAADTAARIEFAQRCPASSVKMGTGTPLRRRETTRSVPRRIHITRAYTFDQTDRERALDERRAILAREELFSARRIFSRRLRDASHRPCALAMAPGGIVDPLTGLRIDDDDGVDPPPSVSHRASSSKPRRRKGKDPRGDAPAVLFSTLTETRSFGRVFGACPTCPTKTPYICERALNARSPQGTWHFEYHYLYPVFKGRRHALSPHDLGGRQRRCRLSSSRHRPFWVSRGGEDHAAEKDPTRSFARSRCRNGRAPTPKDCRDRERHGRDQLRRGRDKELKANSRRGRDGRAA